MRVTCQKILLTPYGRGVVEVSLRPIGSRSGQSDCSRRSAVGAATPWAGRAVVGEVGGRDLFCWSARAVIVRAGATDSL